MIDHVYLFMNLRNLFYVIILFFYDLLGLEEYREELQAEDEEGGEE